jgi:hypothetical protein
MPMTPDRLAAAFIRFGQVECPEDPLYSAICRIVGSEPELLQLLSAAPPEQRRPNLWLAALHDRVLQGVAHPLREYYASVGGTRAPDAALADALRDFARREAPALRQCMQTQRTQTNEIGRCAVLWPALQAIAQRQQATRLALLDVGCSAGLNLGVDHYRYDYGEFSAGADAGPGVPQIACRLLGARRPPGAGAPPWQIVQRLGIDPSPIDVNDDVAMRWLRACIWPSDPARFTRFAQAVTLARQQRWPVRQQADCTAAIADWLSSVPDGVLPVIFNSWVLAYFEPDPLRHHIDTVVQAVRERGAVWLCAEGSDIRVGPIEMPPAAAPPPDAATPPSLWALCTRAGSDVRFDLLARSHPHGRWMEWCD